MPKGKSSCAEGNQGGKDNLRWSEEMDLQLLNALIDETNKGNRHDGSWTTEAYVNVLQLLRCSIGMHLTKNHIKNQMKTLKENFAEAFDLFNGLSGFAWNRTTRKFEAEEEVWDDFIKEKPYAAKWKKMQIKHYDMLRELFGADRAGGRGTHTSKERREGLERHKDTIDLNDEFQDVRFREPNIDFFEEIPLPSPNMDIVSPGLGGQSNQSAGTSVSRGTKRKAAAMSEIMESQFEKVHLEINTLAVAVKDSTNSLVSIAHQHVQLAEKGFEFMQQSRVRHHSESDVWTALTKLGVLEAYQMQCYDFLCENEQRKRKFFGMPRDLRLRYLLDMMNHGGQQ